MKEQSSPNRFSRRRLLFGAAVASTAAPALALSTITTFATRLERVSIPLTGVSERTAAALDGFKIALAADLHLGENVPYSFLEGALRALANERADLTVWGGDFIAVNGSTLAKSASSLTRMIHPGRNAGHTVERPYYEQGEFLAEQLGELLKTRADGPSVAVRGNHETWVAPKSFAAAMAHSGTELLVNQNTVVGRNGTLIEIAGVDDFWNGIPIAPSFRNDAAFKILVSHNPDYVGVLEQAGRLNFHLALCGHTHGGQIRLPGIGAVTYNAQSRFTGGLAVARAPGDAVAQAAYVYTSRGLGVVEIPLRINCPPEVTILTLTAT
jgi:predicted MPP superfamily phosphohydrolase